MSRLRPLSGPERLWRHAAAPGAPFAISIVLRGPVRTAGLQDALNAATKANPGARGTLVAGWSGPRWELGPLPKVQELRAPVSPGPVALWLPDAPFQLSAGPDTLLFTAHHALMDGRGLWHLVQEVFRAWRGDPLLGGDDSIDDRTLLGQGAPFPKGESSVAATGVHNGALQPIWGQRRIPGRWSQLLSRVGVAVAQHARRDDPDAPVRLDIPVDLRRGIRSTANLTGIACVSPPPQADVPSVASLVEQALRSDQALGWLAESQSLRKLPGPLLPPLIRRKTRQCLERQRFGNTAVLSNLGRVEMEALVGPGFRCQRAFWVPPCGPTTTAFFGLLGTSEALELTCVMPQGLADGGRLDALLDAVQSALD